MRRFLAVASAAVLFQAASMALAADVNFSINVGGAPIVISQPPDFLYPPELGFGVAVGVPYDLFYLNGVYFVFRGGDWYHTTSYGGNWVRVRGRDLPPALRRYKIDQIHSFRDREYGLYRKDREHYRGRRFSPEVRGREERRDMRAPAREERGDRREQGRERGEERRDR